MIPLPPHRDPDSLPAGAGRGAAGWPCLIKTRVSPPVFCFPEGRGGGKVMVLAPAWERGVLTHAS